MKLNVILISYNQQNYIRQAIESILVQKLDGEVEVVVADDASQDGTFDIIKEYEGKSPFRFVYMPRDVNVGMRMNYKRAFAACDGDYVAILEGDDWWSSEDHLQQHVDFLKKHKKCAMSFNRINYHNDNNGEFDLSYWPFPSESYTYTLKDLIVDGDMIVNLSSCVFRTALIKTLPDAFFELDFADWELGMWMAQYGKIATLKQSTSVYRCNPNGQWTHLDDESKKRSKIRTMDAMDAFFGFRYKKWFDKGRYMIENDIEPLPYMTWKTKIKRILHIVK